MGTFFHIPRKLTSLTRVTGLTCLDPAPKIAFTPAIAYASERPRS